MRSVRGRRSVQIRPTARMQQRGRHQPGDLAAEGVVEHPQPARGAPAAAGVGRATTHRAGLVAGQAANTGGRWGPTGWLRMFNDSLGGQISWLMPAALIFVVGLVWTLRRSRTDRTRAALLLWGGWLVITGIVFSLGEGIIHEYYTVGAGPGRRRPRRDRRRLPVEAAGSDLEPGRDGRHRRRHGVVGHPTARSQPDWNPAAPADLRERRPRCGAAAPAPALRPGRCAWVWPPRSWPRWSGPSPPAWPRRPPRTAAPSRRRRRPSPSGRGGPVAAGSRRRGFGAARTVVPARRVSHAGGRGGARGTGGGPGACSTPSRRRRPSWPRLEDNAGRYRWVAATIGANEAAGYKLATDRPVMAIGGFNGTEPSPTLAEFQARVRAGRDPLVHRRFGGFGGFGGRGSIRHGWSSTSSR